MVTYRIRWQIALVTALPGPVLLAVILAVIVRPHAVGGLVGLLVAGVAAAPTILRIRRRMLRVTDDGLELQRDKYGLAVSWNDITGVTRRRLQGLLPVDELHLATANLVGRDSRGRAVDVPPSLTGHPAARRIQVSLYDKHWRSGPVGEQLRRRGLLEPVDG